MPTASASWIQKLAGDGAVVRGVNLAALTGDNGPDLDCAEREFQAKIVELAERNGFRTFHVYDSRRSNPGFPDLVLARRGTLIFAELKSETGRATKEQAEWIGVLALTGAAIVRLWRPSDWDEIEATLAPAGLKADGRKRPRPHSLRTRLLEALRSCHPLPCSTAELIDVCAPGRTNARAQTWDCLRSLEKAGLIEKAATAGPGATTTWKTTDRGAAE